jgi:hypothetical protein
MCMEWAQDVAVVALQVVGPYPASVLGVWSTRAVYVCLCERRGLSPPFGPPGQARRLANAIVSRSSGPPLLTCEVQLHRFS